MEILIKQQPEELVQAAAQRFNEVAQESIAARGRFIVALAGGSTPRALYELLATNEPGIEWRKTLIFFGDERAVAPDDERSNYRMAREAFLDRIPIPPDNIFPMLRALPNDNGDLRQGLKRAARDYEGQLRALQSPLDLVLLGMGDNGHTASLFPHTPALADRERWCVATDVAPREPRVPRLTLTYPVLNTARNVFLLVTGADKAERLAAVLKGPHDLESLPVQGIQPQSGHLVWMLDAAAALAM